VRKALVFCFVDLSFQLEKEQYEAVLGQLNSNQQQLINIYLDRRKQDEE